MEFRLTYEGILLGASRNNSRASHKHQLRKVFHKQLRRLWELHPAYEMWRPTEDPTASGTQFYNQVLETFARYGYSFFPLATLQMSLVCKVSILFLRPDIPGNFIKSGDIDNRLKTVFDALRLPHNQSELAGCAPNEDEAPFFCLLEDDSLITHVSVETDTLLHPTGEEWLRNDARLVITVELRPYRVIMQNLSFG